jgi:hypothetical protein
MFSITAVAAPCKPNCQGCGWPVGAAAIAAPAPRTVTLVTKNAIHRFSIVLFAPEKRPQWAPSFTAHRTCDVRFGPANTA